MLTSNPNDTGKLLDQHHQRQVSHQTQAPPRETALGSQFPEVEQLLSEIKELKATVKNNESKIASLEQKVNSLTGEVKILNAKLAVAKHVSTLLSEKIDDQEQYSRRPCLVFEALNSVDDDNKNLSQEINIVRDELNVEISGDDIDKSHPIKKIKENRYIVKFTKHSTAETIYKHRKKLIKKKEDKTNQPIKIKVSLTRRRQKLLEYVSKVTDDYSLIHFVYADINGNLKIRLMEPIKSRMVFSFNSKMELAEILGLIEHFEHYTKFGEATNRTVKMSKV